MDGRWKIPENFLNSCNFATNWIRQILDIIEIRVRYVRTSLTITRIHFQVQKEKTRHANHEMRFGIRKKFVEPVDFGPLKIRLQVFLQLILLHVNLTNCL